MIPAAYPQWYSDWMDYHLDLYGLASDENVSASFMHWWPAFHAIGVQQFELMSERDANGMPLLDSLGATDIMHRQGNTPFKVSQHFDRLLATIGDIRTKRDNLLAIKREMANVDTIGVCDNCGDTGFVNVPHGKNFEKIDGVWTWKINHYGQRYGNPIHIEMVVTCTCPKGIKIQSRYKSPPTDSDTTGKKKRKKDSTPSVTPMSLERFEELFTPDWRRIMREVAATKKQIEQTRMNNVHSATDLIADLAKKAKLPPKPKPKPKECDDARQPKASKAGRTAKAVRSADEGKAGGREEVHAGRDSGEAGEGGGSPSDWYEGNPYE